MKRLLIGIALGMAIAAPSAMALRASRPPEFTEWNTNTFAQLNNFLLTLWNITNGRTTMDAVTADPDGTRTCSVGELVFYDTVTDKVCVCAVESTRKWNCWDAI
jgi:hypothetical protein